jgi:hypothetical protein
MRPDRLDDLFARRSLSVSFHCASIEFGDGSKIAFQLRFEFSILNVIAKQSDNYLRMKVMLQLLNVTGGPESRWTDGGGRKRMIKALDTRGTAAETAVAHRFWLWSPLLS